MDNLHITLQGICKVGLQGFILDNDECRIVMLSPYYMNSSILDFVPVSNSTTLSYKIIGPHMVQLSNKIIYVGSMRVNISSVLFILFLQVYSQVC